jgi:hypothetical protein
MIRPAVSEAFSTSRSACLAVSGRRSPPDRCRWAGRATGRPPALMSVISSFEPFGRMRQTVLAGKVEQHPDGAANAWRRMPKSLCIPMPSSDRSPPNAQSRLSARQRPRDRYRPAVPLA